MTIMAVRGASILMLLLAILLDTHVLTWLKRVEAQFLAAIVVLAVFLIYDVLTGLTLGISLLIAYFRVYTDELGVSLWSTKSVNYYGSGVKGLVQKYITPEHLEAAQSNVVDKKNSAVEMKGIQGVYGEPVYGAQGIDATMPGYEPSVGAVL